MVVLTGIGALSADGGGRSGYQGTVADIRLGDLIGSCTRDGFRRIEIIVLISHCVDIRADDAGDLGIADAHRPGQVGCASVGDLEAVGDALIQRGISRRLRHHGKGHGRDDYSRLGWGRRGRIEWPACNDQ
jgi:hypothetical protein